MTVDLLDRSFDLCYRPSVGHHSFYELDIVYDMLDVRGVTTRRENYRGRFERTVESIEAGRVVEWISWRNVGHRDAPSGREYGPWKYPEWAQLLRYRFVAEDEYDEFPWPYDAFPRDDEVWPISWNIALLSVDAHFEFDFLRSVRHGAIDRLRRVGDSVLAPDASKTFWLGLPPVIETPAFTKPNLTTTFAGLTKVSEQPCALIDFSMGTGVFEVRIGNMVEKLSSSFQGTLTVALDDGSLERGSFSEYVFGGEAVMRPRYQIHRIPAADFFAASGELGT
jgi:hypothetical protein